MSVFCVQVLSVIAAMHESDSSVTDDSSLLLELTHAFLIVA